MRKFIAPFLLIIVVFVFFYQFVLKGLLPIPSDTVIGLYHPFRDMYAKDYPNGIPFKNFLITDPVRQQYPWRKLSVEVQKRFELPLWNPYSFSGTPLHANFQTASFYPLNLLFFILPFDISWSIIIFLEPLLASIFMYLFLKNLKLNFVSSILGSIVFSFSGFSIAWMEWGTVIHTAIWLPLILLSIDKVFYYFVENSKFKIKNSKFQFKNQKLLLWSFVFIFSLVSSFFAGHLQIFFYVFIFSLVYLLVRWIQFGKNLKILILFLISHLSFLILTFVQWFPTLQLILESARGVDQNWQIEGWFLPWKHLIQFIAPDFFGNPTTLNYWGVWNYAELVGYLGILPLILVIFALFFRRDKKTLFFGSLFVISLIFALPTFMAKIPYVLNTPFLSSSQPTRLLFLTCFSGLVLAALGFDYFNRFKQKEIFYSLFFLFLILLFLWISIFINPYKIDSQNLLVSKRNLIFPSILFTSSFFLILLKVLIKGKFIATILSGIIVLVVVFDLFRFGFKFIPFTKREYLFPNTNAIDFIKKNIGNYRLMSNDPRILPPNFSVLYKIQAIDGYDPLYLLRYGELIAASERGEPNISPPFGFNRIINPKKFDSKIIDLLGVKYVLSLTELNSPKLSKVFQEGQTRIYENKDVLPRAFFVENVIKVENKEEAIKKMFEKDFDLVKTAVFEQEALPGNAVKWWEKKFSKRKADILEYSENKMVIKTQNEFDGFLVLTDSFYPNWRVKLYNLDDPNFENPSNVGESRVILTDFNFKGVFVPAGNHRIEFFISLFPYIDL